MDFIAQLKKSVASLALAVMAATFIAPIAQAELGFTDDAEIPSWAEEAIQELMDQGVVAGNDDGSFAPNRQLNRAEVSKVIVLASGVGMDTTGGPHFPDVEAGAWYYDYIETMYNYGWVNGYPDGLFRPGVGINRSEIAKMVVNAFEIEQDLSGAPHFDDVAESDWFYGYVETAYNNGLMRGYGDGTFGPGNAVTRAETALIVYNGQLVVAEPTGPAEGTLEVSLSDYTPRGTNVPYNATSVPYLTNELTASDDSDVEVSSLTFTRLGLGDNDDFENVWLEIDGFKVGNDKSVNNDDIVELRFNPPIVVPAGQTLVADTVASAKYTATDKNIGHHSRFALVSAEDVVSTAANVVGDFPIEGEEMEVADYLVSILQFTELGADTTIDVGDNFIEVGKFRVLNASTTNKDVELRAITFKNDGTAELEDNLENVALYVSGEQVSAETIIDGDYITFRLDNGVTGGYVIEDGDSRIFSVRADIVSAERNDTIQLKVDNYEDIVGVEIGTSFGVKATDPSGFNAEDTYATLAIYTIDSGDLNVSRDPSSLGNQQYAPGSNDVVFMTARLVVDQPLLVDGVHIWVTSDSRAESNASPARGDADATDEELADFNAVYDNFRLYLNDRLVDTENDFEDAATNATLAADDDYRLNFNTTFEIAGTSILKVIGNVDDNSYGAATDFDRLKLKVASADFQSPEYISTGDQVQSTQLLGSATGSFVEVRSSTLTVTETSGLSNGDKLVSGVDDVTFMEFVVDNNDSGDVNVTSLTVGVDRFTNVGSAAATDTGVSGSARTYTNFTLAVFVDGTQQGSAKNLSSTGKATFNDLSVVIPSASQKEFTIVVDTIEASATAISTAVGSDTSGSATVTVTSSTGMTVGDLVVFAETGQTDEVRSITTVTNATTIVVNAVTTNNFAGGGTATVRHQMKLDLEAMSADNVENGQTVTVTNDGTTALSAHTTEATSAGGNEIAGTLFELVSSGALTVSLDSTTASDVLIGGQSNADVLKVRFSAANDEVQIKDLYFENDVNASGAVDNTTTGERVDFKLYNEAGQLIQQKTMSSGALHFELANQDRIRVPKDDSTFVTLKVDVRNITRANQTGTRLLVALDADNATHKGVEAVTAATGSDITVPSAGWGDAVGQDYVIYRSQVTIAPAAVQPAMNLPSASSTEFYRFTVTADQAGNVDVARVSMDVALNGLAFSETNTAAFTTKKIVNGQPDNNQTFTTTAVSNTEAATTADTNIAFTNVRLVVNLTGERLAAGESRSYAVFVSNTEEAGNAENSDGVTVNLLRDTAYASAGIKTARTNATAAYTSIAASDTTTTAVITDANAALANISVGDYLLLLEGTGALYHLKQVASISSNDTNTTYTWTGAIAAWGDNAATDTLQKLSYVGTAVVSDAGTAAETTFSTLNANALTARISIGDTVIIVDDEATDVTYSRTITNVTATATVTTYTFAAITGYNDAATDTIRRYDDQNTYVVWSDESDPSHSTTTSDWLNGYLLDVDTNGKRIQK